MTDLRGARVVVTRAVAQAVELIEAVVDAGGVPVVLPLLEIGPPPDPVGLHDALAGLADGDWLAVLSPNGARSVVAATPEPRLFRVAVVGAATAAVLESAGWTVDLVPPTPTAHSLVDRLAGEAISRCVVVQAAGGRPTLAEGLRARGWEVDVVVGYENLVPDLDPDAVEAAARADVAIFTSPSAVDRYAAVLGTRPARAVCIGPVTEAAAGAAGFATVTATEPTVPAMVDAALGHLR